MLSAWDPFFIDGVDVDSHFLILSYKTKLRAHKLCCGESSAFKVPLRSNFDTPFFLQKCKLEVSNKQRAKPFSDTKLGSISFEARFLMFFRPPLFKCESPRHAGLNTKLADMTSMTQPIQMKLVQIVSRLVDFFRSRLLVAPVFKKILTQA